MESDEPFTEKEFDYIASNDNDLRKLKSEYFKTAVKDTTIESVEINAIDTKSDSTKPLGRIEYENFIQCILPKEEDTDSSDIDAIIYIVAPVLIKGRGNSLRGICDGVSIDFKVTDKEFLESVYNHDVSFSNGTYIRCKMRITQKVNLQDNSVKISRDVFEVSEINDDDSASFKKIIHRRKKWADNNLAQLSLFDDYSF